MVKIPKEQRRYCPHCDEHTEQTVKQVTNQSASPFSKKHRKRQRKIEHGYGSFPFEDPSHLARGKSNPTSDKKDLQFNCKECGKSWKPKKSIRAAKFEIER
ncbi:MAG: 50S ribosomal protein L44e [Candidatus Nanohaloarchaea archaeon]